MVDISDLCQKEEMELIAGGKFAENGKLVDQPDIYHHIARLVYIWLFWPGRI